MPRTYKQPFKKKYRNISPNNLNLHLHQQDQVLTAQVVYLSGFMSNMVQGFSFGTGVQAAKEMFDFRHSKRTPIYTRIYTR